MCAEILDTTYGVIVLTEWGVSDTIAVQRFEGTFRGFKEAFIYMFQVVKRDGEIADFSMNKISSAINKAFVAKEKNYSNDMIELLTLRVTADFQNKIKENKILVEDIQDSVENVLIQAGYADVAKAYSVKKCAI